MLPRQGKQGKRHKAATFGPRGAERKCTMQIGRPRGQSTPSKMLKNAFRASKKLKTTFCENTWKCDFLHENKFFWDFQIFENVEKYFPGCPGNPGRGGPEWPGPEMPQSAGATTFL